jgi:hypothetical protein
MDKLFSHVLLVILLVTNTTLSAAPTLKEQLALGLKTICDTISTVIATAPGHKSYQTAEQQPDNQLTRSPPENLRLKQEQEWGELHSSVNQQDYSEEEWKLYSYLKDKTHINTGYYSINFDKCKGVLRLDEDALVETLENTNRKLNNDQLNINDFTFTAKSGKSHRYLGFEIRKAHYAQDAAAGTNRIEEAIKQSVYD